MGDESLDSEFGKMVKAAAQWLTDCDADNDTSKDKSSKTKAAQRQGLVSLRGEMTESIVTIVISKLINSLIRLQFRCVSIISILLHCIHYNNIIYHSL
jgi:hypothetical protein